MPRAMFRFRAVLAVLAALAALAATPRRGAAEESAHGSLTVGGVERTWRLHSPKRDRTKPAPLVFVLHGGSGTAEGMEEKLTERGLDALADRDGWIVCYPEGIEKQWNDGRHVETAKERVHVDDLAFFTALLEKLAKDENVDRKRVYSTGISNGGFMSHRLAREMSDRFAAIAPVAANLQVEADVATVPSYAVSVLAISGTKDPLVPWEGGEVHAMFIKRGKCRSVAETIAWWVKVDGCAEEAEKTDLPDTDPKDGTRVRREAHGGGKDGTEVVLLAVEEGGHTWPGGWQYLPEKIIGKTSRDIDANKVIWEFFKKHARP